MPAKELRLVLVTPEQTLLDQAVTSLRVPLFDGQIGILPGRAPIVGRLGHGELTIRDSAGQRAYYIAGGFAQVKGVVVSLLTDRAILVEDVDSEQAETQLSEAMAIHARGDDEIEARQRAIDRARGLRAVAGRSRQG